MALLNSTDKVVFTQGGLTVRPVLQDDLDKICRSLSDINKREIEYLGYGNVKEAMEEMYQSSDSYIVTNQDNDMVCLSGLFYSSSQEPPQMYAMFSDKIENHKIGLLKGSLKLANLFMKGHDTITMSILAENDFMLDWAAWLKFTAVGFTLYREKQYVDFVRCDHKQNFVYNDASRPAIH